jgi:phosphoserine aminotransferase
MQRVYNFAPGPSMLAEDVLKKAQEELLCFGSAGMSVMEMSHRAKMFTDIYDETVSLLRELMDIPENYRVLLLQGGATQQFSAVPLNLTRTGKADYVDSGNFAHSAAQEAQKYTTVRIAGSSREDQYTYIPDFTVDPQADYVHVTMNNTIYGTRFTQTPDTGDVPLVADLSSCILSEPYDVRKFGVIYAGAQKNIGPSGLCVVIVREDLLGRALPVCPKLYDWQAEARADSMINTPNTFGIYMAGLSFKWLKAQGGVRAIEQRNVEKAQMLYDTLDESRLFKTTAQKAFRSRMNVTFVTGDAELDAKFVKEAAAAGLVNLKGHRTVGGMRASIYNAMPVEGVRALCAFIRLFEQQNG